MPTPRKDSLSCTCNPYLCFRLCSWSHPGKLCFWWPRNRKLNENTKLGEGGKCLSSLWEKAHGFHFHSVVQYLLKVYCMPNSARCQENHSKPLHCCTFIGPLEHASMGQTKKKYNDTKQCI